MMFGASFFSFMMGMMSTILSAADNKSRVTGEKILVIHEYCVESQLNFAQREKMRSAVRYKNSKYNFTVFEGTTILEDIPMSLKYNVSFFCIYRWLSVSKTMSYNQFHSLILLMILY